MEADLRQYYQVRLTDMYRGVESVREVSVLAAQLPRGSRVAERLGGPAAVTAEVEAGWLVEHALYRVAHGQSGKSTAGPKMRDYPKPWDEGSRVEEKKLSKLERAEARRLEQLAAHTPKRVE